jgi:hypothetical protein
LASLLTAVLFYSFEGFFSGKDSLTTGSVSLVSLIGYGAGFD